jgi:protoporphyrinogen oxidase
MVFLKLSFRLFSRITSGNRAVALVLEDGREIPYDHIISSMPLSLLVERLPGVPAMILENNLKLSFRNTILVYLRVDHPELFSDQWLYIHDSSVRMGRVTNFRNWTSSLYGESGETILCLEYWCFFEDGIWKQEDASLVELAREEIVRTGLVREGQVIEGSVVRLPRCYPVYFMGYREILEPIESYLSGIQGLHVIGRYGAYKYNNQDHSILMGIRAAENILEEKEHDLWSINTDYEVYQEASVITRTGLVSTAQS